MMIDFLVWMIIIGIFLVIGGTVCFLKLAEFAKIDPIFDGELYFESIKDMDPYEGVDYIISYIEDPRWGCPQTDIDKFLLYLAKRDDKFGQVAREKLNEIGD